MNTFIIIFKISKKKLKRVTGVQILLQVAIYFVPAMFVAHTPCSDLALTPILDVHEVCGLAVPTLDANIHVTNMSQIGI